MTTTETKQHYGPMSMDDALRIARKNGEEVVPTFCGMCGPGPFGCGIYAFVKNGHFITALLPITGYSKVS